MNVQIVLHAAVQPGGFRCSTFVSDPAANPFQIVVAPGDPSVAALRHARRLGRILRTECRLLSGHARQTAPCHGFCPGPTRCKFSMGGRLLILTGGGATSMTIPGWAAGSAWNFLCVFPSSARAQVAGLLPPPLSTRLAAFWDSSPGEVIPPILATVGLTWERPRIFVSYRREETQGLANQLFHRLAEKGFDVFLDHCRLAPGMGLVSRIRQELGDKTMVVVLESSNLLDSRWTRYEILVARTLRLGLLALALPGGQPIPEIGANHRQTITLTDFTRNQLTRRAVLRKRVLDEVVSKIRFQHDRAIIARRQQVIGSLQSALLLAGIRTQHFDSHGRLHAKSPAPASRDYVVSVASRPPQLADFHRANDPAPPSPAILIGITRTLERQIREQITWLQGVANTAVYDEGKIAQAAADIAANTL